MRATCHCHIATFALLCGLLFGQEPDSTAQSKQAPGGGLNKPVPTFYAPPDLAGAWDSARKTIRNASAEQFTPDFVITILDSLLSAVEASNDSLLLRARAIEKDDRGYTRKFYRAHVARNDILDDPIPKNLAAKIPHFSVIYDPQGHLERVRYIEPQVWLQRQKKLAAQAFQPPAAEPLLVRYFKSFNLPRLNGGEYLKKKKLDDVKAHYRVVYDGDNVVQQAQSVDANGSIAWQIKWDATAKEGANYGTLNFTNTDAPNLLMLDNQVFLPERSIVRSNWTAAVTRDESGNLTSVQVFNQYDQLSYYYTFKLEDSEKSREQTLRAELHGEGDNVEQRYSLAYDKFGQLSNRTFYNAEGEVLRSSDFIYRPKHGFIQITTRNNDGVVVDRKTVPYQAAKD